MAEWERGRSPNPGGRPPLTAKARETLRKMQDFSEEVLRAYVEALRCDEQKWRLHAADRLADRIWGKVRELQPDAEPALDIARLPPAERAAVLRERARVMVEAAELVETGMQ